MKFSEGLLFKLVAIACCIIIALITVFGVVACCMIKDQNFVKNVELNENGELVITLTDGNEVNLGVVVGEDGENAVGIETIHQNGDKVTIVLTDYSVYEIDLSGNKIS